MVLCLSSELVQKSQSLQEQAYQIIRGAILKGELAPGERLVETKLAKKLQVSRTPIREALRQLQKEDIVKVGANSVLTVAVFSVQDAIQLYDCRLALEQLAVEQAINQITIEQIQALEEMVAEATQLTSSHQQSGITDWQMLDLDYQFHRCLAESAANVWLSNLLDQVFDKMIVIRSQTLQHNPQVLNIGDEHLQIVKAISNKDIQGAKIALQQHLNAAKQRVVKEMQKLSNLD